MMKNPVYMCLGLVFCSRCGKQMEVKDGFYVCRSQCVRRIPAREIDTSALNYMKSISSPTAREQIDTLLWDANETRTKREVIDARRRVETIMNELEIFIRKPGIIRLPDELLEWLDRPLPDRTEMIRKAEEAARAATSSVCDCGEYFCVYIPENPEEEPMAASKAADWYIERIDVYDDKLTFASTFDKWLRGKDFRRRECHRIEKRDRKD